MSLVAEESVHVPVARERIWSVFGDAAVLARVLPGCEVLEQVEPGTFRGVVATKLQFLTIRADVVARLVDPRPPEHLRLEFDGRPRGLAGGFRATIPVDLASDGDATEVHYALDLTTTGRLASFGAPIIRETFRRQVAALVRNLEAELGHVGREPAGDDAARPGDGPPG